MGKFVFTTFMLTCLSIAFCLPAEAQWAANVTGPDVFGNTKVVASVNGSTGNGLVVQCDQSSTLDLAFLFTATASEMDELSKAGTGIPADLLVKVDQGQVMKFNAMLQVWNDTYIGVVASGRTKDIVSAIDAIGSATSQISVVISSFWGLLVFYLQNRAQKELQAFKKKSILWRPIIA